MDKSSKEYYHITGIDPGPACSACVTVAIPITGLIQNIHTSKITYCEFVENEYLVTVFGSSVFGYKSPKNVIASNPNWLVIEGLANYNSPWGNSLISTAYWIGRFWDRWITSQCGTPDTVKIYSASTIRARLLGDNKQSSSKVRTKVGELWAPHSHIDHMNRHRTMALSVVTHHIIRTLGLKFFKCD